MKSTRSQVKCKRACKQTKNTHYKQWLTFLLHQLMLALYQPFSLPLIPFLFANLDDFSSVLQFWPPSCVFLPIIHNEILVEACAYPARRHFLLSLKLGRGRTIAIDEIYSYSTSLLKRRTKPRKKARIIFNLIILVKRKLDNLEYLNSCSVDKSNFYPTLVKMFMSHWSESAE